MYYQNPYLMQQPQNSNNGFVAVSGEQEARNYPVAYGNSVTFKDENAPYLYTKTAISQMEAPIFKKFKIVEELPQNAPQNVQGYDLSTFVTKDEFGALREELRALQEALGGVGNGKQ
jgi:hypothetical protein